MKKFSFVIIFSILSLTLFSCATAITVGKDLNSYELKSQNEKCEMEFIGYKADANILSTASETRLDNVTGVFVKAVNVLSPFDQWKAISENDGLRTLGLNLQSRNLAIDQSFAYFGIYSLQELELYKSKTRYVTFVEVAQNKYDYNDRNIKGAAILGGAGIGFMAGGIPLLAVGAAYQNDKYVSDLADVYTKMGAAFTAIGGVMGIAALLIPAKCTTTFKGLYNIYIYDTEKKEVIRKEAVSVNSSDQWKGAYIHQGTNKNLIHSYYSKLVSNALLEKYDELNQWLKTRN